MNASADAPPPPPATILPREAEHFGRMAADWWDPDGSSAMLHKLNPARLGYLRSRIDAHWSLDAKARQPLAGRRALDVGCGAGLFAEPLARMGARVVAVDAALENIAIAEAHARTQGLLIDYRAGELSTAVPAGERFDLITCMEVIEHVADAATFLVALATLLSEDGLLLLSTPNRTPLSRLALITIGEGLGRIPRGTHDWSRFLTPDELAHMLGNAGLEVIDRKGLSFSPTRGFTLSDTLTLDYFLTATPRRSRLPLAGPGERRPDQS